MTTPEPPAETVNKVTEQLHSLLAATGTRAAMPSPWAVERVAKEIIVMCNEHKIVADDKLLTGLSRELWPEDN